MNIGKNFVRLILMLMCWEVARVQAQPHSDDGMLNFKAEKYYSNFDTQITTFEGDVKLDFANSKVSADKLKLNSKTGSVEAEGNIHFQQGNLNVYGDSVKVDMKTGLGTFYNGRLSIEDGVTIEGKVLSRVAPDRYSIQNGKVSTCHDCPQSWSMAGSQLDVQVEGYAEIHHALFQIQDTPVAYFPIVYFPVKTKRQSGFLLPQFSAAPEIGPGVFVPYFWAISNNSDATFQLNSMTKGGNRILSEYRYVHSDRTRFSGLGSFGHVNKMEGVPYTRYGYSVGQRWQLAPRWTQRFVGEHTSDGKYTSHYSNEFARTRLPALENEASIAWQNYSLFSYGKVQFTRDNIPRDAGKYAPAPGAHRGDIHKLPAGGIYVPSYSLVGGLLNNSQFEYSNFVREGPNVDPFTHGWIRTGERSSVVSRVSSPRTFEYLKWEPAAEVRGDFYRFPGLSSAKTHAYRSRYLIEQKLDLEFWKVYKTSSESVPAVKHFLTPFMQWSFSDNDKKSAHPFFDKSDAPRFDLFDPNADITKVELATITEEQKLNSHHIVTFGTSTRLIGREGNANRTYSDFLAVTFSRDYNFRLEQFGYMRLNAYGAFKGARLVSDLAFNPKNSDKYYRNEASYENTRFMLGIFESIYRLNNVNTAETYGWNAALKKIGPFVITGMMVYEAISDRVNEQAYNIEFYSPSKCWIFGFGAKQAPNTDKFAYTPTFDITYRESVRKTPN